MSLRRGGRAHRPPADPAAHAKAAPGEDNREPTSRNLRSSAASGAAAVEVDAAAAEMSRASQLDGANGTLRCGTRVQKQAPADGRWYCGTVHDLFAGGTAAIEFDCGEYWTGEGEDVHVLPPHHPGYALMRDADGRVPQAVIAQSFSSSNGQETPDGFAVGTESSGQDRRARKQRSAPSHSPMQTQAPTAGFGFGTAPPVAVAGFSFGATPPVAGGGFAFGAAPPSGGGGFTFGAPPPASGGFSFGS